MLPEADRFTSVFVSNEMMHAVCGLRGSNTECVLPKSVCVLNPLHSMSFSLMQWFTVSKFSWNFEQIKLNKMNMCNICTSETAKLCVVSVKLIFCIKLLTVIDMNYI